MKRQTSERCTSPLMRTREQLVRRTVASPAGADPPTTCAKSCHATTAAKGGRTRCVTRTTAVADKSVETTNDEAPRAHNASRQQTAPAPTDADAHATSQHSLASTWVIEQPGHACRVPASTANAAGRANGRAPSASEHQQSRPAGLHATNHASLGSLYLEETHTIKTKDDQEAAGGVRQNGCDRMTKIK